MVGQTNKTHFVHYFRNYCIHNILLSLSLSSPLCHLPIPFHLGSESFIPVYFVTGGFNGADDGAKPPTTLFLLSYSRKRCYFLFPNLSLFSLRACHYGIMSVFHSCSTLGPSWINLKLSIFSHYVPLQRSSDPLSG